MNRLILPFTGSVHIELYDKDGNLLNVIDKHNEETIWAKLHTPSDIYMDFITKDLKTEFGVDDLSKIIKTSFNQLSRIRSNLLNVHFSRSGTVYSATYNWTNSGSTTNYLYGLVSYSGSDVYTIFDMSENPVEMPPNTVVVGRYQITYNVSTPSIPTESTTSSTVNSNEIMGGIIEPTTPEIREYKYTRTFVKTSDYLGVHTDDTDINSHVLLTVSSSDKYKRAWGQTAVGQIGYKFLSAGNPGGAKGARFVDYYRASQRTRVVSGNVFYHIRSYLYPIVDSSKYCDRMFGYVDALSLDINKDNKDIYPWKFNFIDPANVKHFKDTTWWYNSRGLYCQRYNMFVPRLIYKGVRNYLYQDIMYLYWDVDNPKLTLFAYSYGGMSCSVTINGTEYSPTSITDIGSHNRQIDFDLTGLTAGEGIVVVKFWNAWSMNNTHNGTDDIYFVGPKFQYAGDFYGYAVPFAGFLGHNTSEISDNYISAGLATYDGEVTDLNFEVDYSKLDLVSGTAISELAQKTDHQYWVWVKVSEKDKLAGKVEPYTSGKLLTLWGRYNWNHTNTHVAPVYVGPNNFITFRPTNVDEVDSLSDFLGLEGLLEDTYTLPENNYLTVDSSNREITFNDDIACAILNTTTKSYMVRKQGDTNYNVRIPASMSDYTEGTATITHGSTTYEVETTIEQSETIANLTAQFTSDTVFAANEFVTFPIADGDGAIPTDALETWTKYETYNIPTTEATIVQDESSGSDDILYTGNESSKILYANAEKSIPATYHTLSDSITLDQNQNYKFSIRVVIPKDSDRVAVAIPKRVKDGSDWRYTNIETVVVTDGIRVIPWRLVTYSDYGVLLDDNAVKVEEENYVIILSNETLRQITNNRINVEMVLDVFFKADKLDEILPYEVDFYAGYAPPRKLYPDLKITGNPDDSSISYEFISDKKYTGSVTNTNQAATVIDEYTFQFDPSKKGGLHLTLPTSNLGEEYFVTFKFKANSVPNPPYTSDYMELFCALDGNNHGYGIAIKDNQLVVHKDSIGTVIWGELIPEIQTGQEYLVEMRISMNEVEVYIDGIFIGVYALDVYNDWYYTNKITLGCKYDSSDDYFDGTISHFAIFKYGNIWSFSHKPYTYEQWVDWDNHRNLDRTVYDTNEAIIKVIMPYALPRTIKVIDDNGDDVEFCQLDTGNRVADLNNVVFIKINEKLEWNIENWTVNTVPQVYIPTVSNATDGLYRCMYFRGNGSGASFNGETRQFFNNTPLYYYYSRTANNCCGGVYAKRQPYTYRYKTAIVDETFDLENFEPASFLKGHLDRTFMYWYTHYNYHKKYEIVFNSTDASQDPDTFFPLYVTPENLLSKASTTYNWNDYYSTQDKTTVDISPSSDKGITYDVCDKCNFVEIVGANVGFNARGLYHQKSQPDHSQQYNQVQATAAIDIFATGGLILGDVLSPGSSAFVTSGPDDQCIHPRKQITVYNSINLSSLVSYPRPLYSIWSDETLHCSAVPSNDFRNPLSENINERTVFATKLADPIQLTVNKKLYHADGLLVSREFAVYKIQDDDLLDKDFELKGWTITQFSGLKPYRVDYNGVNPLVSISDTIKFFFTFTEYTKYANTMAQNYILIKEPELVQAFKDGNVKITKTDYGFFSMPDSSLMKLSKGSVTEDDLNLTNAVVISKLYLKQSWYAYNWWNADVRWRVYYQYNYYGQYRYFYRMYYMEPFFKVYSTMFQRFTFPSALSNIYLSEYGPSPKYKTSAMYLLTLNQHIGKFDWSSAKWYKTYPTPVYTDTLYYQSNRALPLDSNIYRAKAFYYYIHDKIPVSVSSNNKVNWTLDNDAVYTDIRYFAINNIRYNVLWDPNKISADKITDFGHFTITGSTTSQNIVVIPIIKVEKTDGSDTKIYAVSDAYTEPYEITELMSDIDNQLDNIVQHSVINLYSFKWFNSLLKSYNTSDYQYQYGWIIYDKDFSSENITVIKSITVQPDLTDINLYQDITFAWYQEELDEIVNTKDDYKPDTTNYKVKVVNKNSIDITNYQVRLDLSELDLSAFSNGVVASVDGSDIPTIYEDEKGRLVSNLSKWNKKYIWVKIPVLHANEIVEILIQDKSNVYMPSDIFDDYYDATNLDTAWTIMEPDFDYHGTGQDTDNYDSSTTYGSIVADVDPFGDSSGITLYEFDGNANDVSGNYNGTWSGNEQYDTGKFNQAAKFDGSSYITIEEPFTSVPYSISCWIKTDQTSDSSNGWDKPTLIGFATGGLSLDWGVELKNGYVHIFRGLGSGNTDLYETTSAFVADNQLHLISVNFDTTKVEVFVDSNLVATFNHVQVNSIDSVSKWYIGVMYNYDGGTLQSSSYYQGLIDQLRIFNRALTQQEIDELYHEEKLALDTSERVIYANHERAISVVDDTIEVRSVLPVAMKSKFSFDDNKEYLIGYGDADDIMFDVYVTPDDPDLVETTTGQKNTDGRVVVDFKIPYGKTQASRTNELLTDSVVYYKYEGGSQLKTIFYDEHQSTTSYIEYTSNEVPQSILPLKRINLEPSIAIPYVSYQTGFINNNRMSTLNWVYNLTCVNGFSKTNTTIYIYTVEYFEDFKYALFDSDFVYTTQSSNYLKTLLDTEGKIKYYTLHFTSAYIVGQYLANSVSEISHLENVTQTDWAYGENNVSLFSGDLQLGNMYSSVSYYKRARSDNFFSKGWLSCYSDFGFYKTSTFSSFYDLYKSDRYTYFTMMISVDAIGTYNATIYYLNGINYSTYFADDSYSLSHYAHQPFLYSFYYYQDTSGVIVYKSSLYKHPIDLHWKVGSHSNGSFVVDSETYDDKFELDVFINSTITIDGINYFIAKAPPAWRYDFDLNNFKRFVPYLTTKPEIQLTIKTTSTGLRYRYDYPFEHPTQWNKYWEDELKPHDPIDLSSGGKLVFYMNTGDHKTHIYYIKARQRVDKPIIQLMKKDLYLLVENIGQNYMIADFTATATPTGDRDTLQAKIDVVREHNKSWDFKDIEDWPYATRIGRGKAALGYTFQYGFNHIF